jgi:4-hydroxybenzoate polyprenyltransferase
MIQRSGIKEIVMSFLSLVKFSHTIFAMPFALVGFVLALATSDKTFTWQLFVPVIVAMVTARNAAMAFNRYADRKIDAANPRTSGREIPSGKLSENGVLFFIVANLLLFVVSTWFINMASFILSFPTLAVLIGYSYMKRITWLSHYVLGIALAIAPSGAYIAVTGVLEPAPVILSILVFLWVSGFDIIYSLSDEKFDREHALYSIPGAKGRRNALRISSAGHIMVFPFLILFFLEVNNSYGQLLGLYYITGSLLFCALLLWQHSIISAKDISRVNAAFFTANGFASLLFALLTIADLLF